MRISRVIYLVSRKINDRYYPVIAFVTKSKAEQYKAEQYKADNPAEYTIDIIDFEYEIDLY